MTDILVVLETRDGAVRPASLEALGAARRAADESGGGTVTALSTERTGLEPAEAGAAGADKLLVAGADAHSPDGAAATAARVAQEIGAGAVFLAATIHKPYAPQCPVLALSGPTCSAPLRPFRPLGGNSRRGRDARLRVNSGGR